MDYFEWYALRKKNPHMSDDEFKVFAWNKQMEDAREFFLKQRKQKEEEKLIEKQLESELSKNLDKTIKKALLNGKSKMNIKIKI